LLLLLLLLDVSCLLHDVVLLLLQLPAELLCACAQALGALTRRRVLLQLQAAHQICTSWHA
jgi:hypothetical protein